MSTPPQVPQEAPSAPFPRIRRDLSPTAPLGWISRGFSDFRSCPGTSMFYRCIFAAMGFVASVVLARHYQYLAALICGFLLLGPFLAIGLYEVSRRRARGYACGLRPTLAAWRPNAGNIGVYSLVLTVIFLVWARASLVTFALFYNTDMPTLKGFLSQVLTLDNAEFLVAYAAVAAVFGTVTFAASVVSVPLMLDRNQDSITAMIASFLALARNLPAMIVWGMLILSLTLIGFATLYIGLIFTAPLLGHGTWHAYIDLLEPQET